MKTASFSIRSAIEEEASVLAKIQIACWKERLSTWAPASFVDSFNEEIQTQKLKKRIRSKTHTLFIAEAEGTLVGFIGTRPVPDIFAPLFDLEIFGFYVTPAFERRGIGTALFKTLLDKTAPLRLIVFTFQANAPARQRYLACGGTLLSVTENPELADLDVMSQ